MNYTIKLSWLQERYILLYIYIWQLLRFYSTYSVKSIFWDDSVNKAKTFFTLAKIRLLLFLYYTLWLRNRSREFVASLSLPLIFHSSRFVNYSAKIWMARKEWPDNSNGYFLETKRVNSRRGQSFPRAKKRYGCVRGFLFLAFDNFDGPSTERADNSYQSESMVHNFVWTNHYCGHPRTVRQIHLHGSCPTHVKLRRMIDYAEYTDDWRKDCSELAQEIAMDYYRERFISCVYKNRTLDS